MTYRSFVTALIAAGFFAAGEGFDWPLLRQLGAALLVVFVLAYLWSRLNIARLSARRELDTRSLQVGSVFSEHLAVRSKTLLPKLWIELRDRCVLPAHDASRVFGLRSRGAVIMADPVDCRTTRRLSDGAGRPSNERPVRHLFARTAHRLRRTRNRLSTGVPARALRASRRPIVRWAHISTAAPRLPRRQYLRFATTPPAIHSIALLGARPRAPES